MEVGGEAVIVVVGGGCGVVVGGGGVGGVGGVVLGVGGFGSGRMQQVPYWIRKRVNTLASRVMSGEWRAEECFGVWKS